MERNLLFVINAKVKNHKNKNSDIMEELTKNMSQEEKFDVIKSILILYYSLNLCHQCGTDLEDKFCNKCGKNMTYKKVLKDIIDIALDYDNTKTLAGDLLKFAEDSYIKKLK